MIVRTRRAAPAKRGPGFSAFTAALVSGDSIGSAPKAPVHFWARCFSRLESLNTSAQVTDAMTEANRRW